MFDDNYNREEVDNIIESVTHHIVGFKEGLEHLGIRQIEENVSPMSLHDFNKLVKIFLSKFDYLVSLVNELKEFRNTSEIFEELNNSLSWFDHETETLLHSPTDTDKIQELIDILEKSIILLNSKILPIRISNQQSQQLIEENLAPKIKEIEEKVKDFDSARLALEMRETDQIYLDLHNKYNKEYELNNIYFGGALITSIVFTLVSILVSAIFKPIDWVIFISVKVLILTVGITLCTIFLRRSAHAKKLKEQAYQTHVEITAFPIHVRSLKEEDKHELIKELALKYFGKELDQTQNDKVGDLIKDQLAAGTELVKASRELLKKP
ncbi:hypothetical protein ACE01U_10995 [Acinetobacter sp. BSP-153]|uniref:hypothetical protein n=1 Tax=Acinetobacter sp. BSP-153 TaxID=3344663 RepID=UPI00377025C6